MQSTTVFFVLMILVAIGYMIGHKRSHAVATDHGGLKALHSLPRHYGYMAALWAALPAILLLFLWMGFESKVIHSIILTGLPADVQQLPADQLGLYYNQIISYARDIIDRRRDKLSGCVHQEC